MAHLIEKGYRRIGFVTVDLNLVQMEERLKAYIRHYAARQGLTTDNLVLT